MIPAQRYGAARLHYALFYRKRVVVMKVTLLLASMALGLMNCGVVWAQGAAGTGGAGRA